MVDYFSDRDAFPEIESCGVDLSTYDLVFKFKASYQKHFQCFNADEDMESDQVRSVKEKKERRKSIGEISGPSCLRSTRLGG